MLDVNSFNDSIEHLKINRNTIDCINPINMINIMNVLYSFVSIIKLDKYKRCKNIAIIDICNNNKIKIKLSDYHFESISKSNCSNIEVFRLENEKCNFFEVFGTYIFKDNFYLISVNFSNCSDYYDNSEKILNLFPLFFSWLVKNKIKNDIESVVTKKEKVVLSYLVDGKTNWEIAKILNVSENSIKFHLKNLLRKTNSNNRSHLISIAFKYNLVGCCDIDLVQIGF